MTGDIERYLHYQETLGRSVKTVKLRRWQLDKFREFVGTRPSVEITREDLALFQDQLAASSMAESSRASILFTVRLFFAWLHEEGRIVADVGQAVEIAKPVDPIPEKPPSEMEVAEILESVVPDSYRGKLHRAVLELLYGCGLRRAEAAGLTLKDVDFARESVAVHGKGNKERLLPLAGAALQHLNVYLAARNGAPSPRLFVKESGGPFKPSDLDNLFGKLRKVLRKNVHPHMLRHAFAVHMLRNGADIRVIQALLGHEDIDMTARYLRIVKEDVKRAYDDAMDGIL